MNRFSRRLRPIELSLTPDQAVLLWIKDAIKGKSLDAALRTQRPGEAIGNLVVRGVRDALKGQPEAVIERAVLQACQEANLLYNIAVEINHSVQNQHLQRRGEFFILSCMFAAAIEACSEELELLARLATLSVVEPVLILDAAIHRISAERFGGHSILFTDSVVALKDQLGLVDKAIDAFNCIARHAKFEELDKAEVAERLEPRVSGQVSAWELVAQATMLALSGKREGYRAIFDRLDAVEAESAPSTGSPGGAIALSSLTVHELAKAYVKKKGWKHSGARDRH